MANNRRQFLKAMPIATAAALTLGDALPAQQAETRQFPRRNISRSPGRFRFPEVKFKLAMASYTFRKFNLAQALKMTNRVDIKNIALKSFHLPLNSSPEQIKQVVAQVKQAGINLYGGGVIYMKTEKDVNQAFEYARLAGMKVIIGVPAHNLLPLVEKKAQAYDIKVAIHNHGPGDKLYPTPDSIYEKIKNMDPHIGICQDIGHTQRAGIDPSVATQRIADRLLDVHMKDVTSATKAGSGCEIGRGVINIPRFLRTLVRVGYEGMVAFEYEKDAADPLPGLAESVGYVKGVKAAMIPSFLMRGRARTRG